MGKKKGCRGCLGCGFVGSLALCAVGGIVFWVMIGRPDGGLDAQLEAARKEGVPVEITDLVKGAASDPKLNAATLYPELSKVLETSKNLPSLKIATDPKSTPEQVESALKNLGPALELAEKAVARPNMVPAKEWFTVAEMFPELATSKTGTKLLVAKARAQAGSGDGVAAMKTLARAHTFAKHASQTPMLIGYLVAVADEAIILRGMESVLTLSGRDPRTIAEGRKTLASFGPPPSLVKAMGGEAVLSRDPLNVASADDPLMGPTNDPMEQASRAFVRFAPVRNAFDSKTVEEYRKLFKDMPKDPYDYEGFERALKAMDDRVAKDNSPTAMLLKITTPVFRDAAESMRQAVTLRKLASLSLDLCEMRNKGQRLPRSLQATRKAEIDPYSGDTFLIRQEGKGFILWSVGKNKVDDGGVREDRLDITNEIGG